MSDQYTYPIIGVRRVIDGDSVILRVAKDIGFYIIAETTQRFRLLGVDCPERGQPGFTEATDFTKSWLAAHGPVAQVSSHKTDSFGRWLGYVFVPADEATGRKFTSLNDELLASGHAVVYAR